MKVKSNVDIKDQEKVDILKSLMESVRSQIMFWHDRAYIAATASFGILLTITKLWIDTLNKTIDTQHTQHVIDILNKAVGIPKPTIDTLNKMLVSPIDTPKMILLCTSYVIVIVLTEWFTQIYLEIAEKFYKDNEECKLKCEYALRLKEGDAYLSNKDPNTKKYKFFWAPENDTGMAAKDISSLRKAHMIFACVLVAGFVISLCIYRPEILISLDFLRFSLVAIVSFLIGVTSTIWVYQSTYHLSEDCRKSGCYIYLEDKLIRLSEDKPDKERQLWLLDNHPAFTGSCRNCGYEYPRKPLSWDCPQCGTTYD